MLIKEAEGNTHRIVKPEGVSLDDIREAATQLGLTLIKAELIERPGYDEWETYREYHITLVDYYGELEIVEEQS